MMGLSTFNIFFTLFLLSLSTWQNVYAIDLEGKIKWNDVCRNSSELGHAKVILDNGKRSGGVQRDGSFSIPDVDSGSYVLSVLARDHIFDTLRIDVPESSDSSPSLPEVRPYLLGTPHESALQHPPKNHIVLIARQKANYFTEHEAFSIAGMLRNPMILMMVGTGALMLGMPYMMKNLDPELAKEVGERQAKMATLQSSLQSGDLRGLSSLLGPTEETTNTAHAPATKKSEGNKGRTSTQKGKRR